MKKNTSFTVTPGVNLGPRFEELKPEELVHRLSHEQISKTFGLNIAQSVLASDDQNHTDAAPLLKNLLTAMLEGFTPDEIEEPSEPERFREAKANWVRSSYEISSYWLQIWLERFSDRFVEADSWEQWPIRTLTSTVKSVETGKRVFTIGKGEEYSFFNGEKKVLVKIYRDYMGGLDVTIWGGGWEDVDELTGYVDNYVETPDLYQGKILRLKENGEVEIMELKVGELQSYSDEVEKKVNWLTSIAKSSVRKRLAKVDLPARAGLLLEGPPGSGKTTLARRIAVELSGDTTVVYSSPEATVEEIFEFAHSYEPVLIVLEDVESFFGERGSSDFSSFLDELDGMDQSGGKMVLATTNDSSGFDEAVRRPGRLEQRAVISDIHEGAHLKMVTARLPRESAKIRGKLVEIIREKSGDKPVTPALIDSLARHAIMLDLKGAELVSYAREEWVPHYEGESYL